ncbi:vitamin K epoxide reductase family protein [Micromonospora phytophila]|uniref:vitamin K epoxide reductase family protein n=1 Tax=Micromonospora phytophila TaxID=709888 RepID=UPI00202F06C0|nr:vitamin K epoxide reductase family protein [Micromonospora phytophila]MCM0677950.1 vitamin K epoxide reductase family protein [Micromonospora phytophila]
MNRAPRTDPPERLSAYLRGGRDPELRRRRAVIALSLLGAAMGQIVGAYQTGLLRHLPDPPGPFDSDRVDASGYAYSRLASPDSLMMVVSYGITAWLAGAGGRDRAVRAPALSLLTAAKTAADTVVAIELGREEWRDNRAFCTYCQIATVASALSLALSLPEARRALRRLRGR